MYRESRNNQTGALIGILRIADGANIPLAEGNRDYQDYLDWVAQDNTADPDPYYSIDVIRERKWIEIKDQRDARKSGGVKVAVGGTDYWFHTDDASRIQWIGVKDSARDILTAGGSMTDIVRILGQNLVWKTLSGAFVEVTCQVAFDVVQATKNLDAILFATAETKRAALNTIDHPEAFDTVSGWNKTYEESLQVV